MRHLPNILSLLRLLSTAYVCRLILRGQYSALLWTFFLVAATDAFDGWAARWLRVESKLGQVLDPLADKVLLTGVFIAMSVAGAVPWWVTLVVLGRDAAILLGALALWTMGRRTNFPPSIWGKVSTIFQMGYIVIVAFRGGHDLAAAAYLVVLMAVVSGADYARRLLG